MPTRRFEQLALAQLLGAVAFCACVLIEYAQAQPGYVPPPTPPPPPVLNPSTPNTVPQPSYRPITPSTPSITPSTPSTVPSVEVTPPANKEHPSATAQSEQPSVHSVHHHRGHFPGLTWPYYCGSSPCVVSIRVCLTVTQLPTRRRPCGGPAIMIMHPVNSGVGVHGMGGMEGVPGITGTDHSPLPRALVC